MSPDIHHIDSLRLQLLSREHHEHRAGFFHLAQSAGKDMLALNEGHFVCFSRMRIDC